MNMLISHAQAFAGKTAETLSDLLGVMTESVGTPIESNAFTTSRKIVITLHYTGTVHGEYTLALDESVARALLPDDEDAAPIQECESCEALMEVLNVTSGSAIVELQQQYPKLTLTAPRVLVGEFRYPSIKSAKIDLHTEHGLIECHFCLDAMRLDLSTSYQEAMESLVTVNEQLRHANQTLREQQSMLVHAEKMNSLGVLASGVAHEINNPLFFVESNLETLDDYVDVIETTLRLYEKLADATDQETDDTRSLVESKRAEEDLDFVLQDTKDLMSETAQGVQRIKKIVHGLRQFSPVLQMESDLVDLGGLIETAVTIAEKRLAPGASIHCDLDELPLVRGDASEIGQVLTAVLQNACEAISENGTIEISTRQQNQCIGIQVCDSGPGIEPQALPRLFEPFFTTKSDMGHAGLGLSIAFGLVSKHRGNLRVTNHCDGGTEVSIQLPDPQNETASAAQPAVKETAKT